MVSNQEQGLIGETKAGEPPEGWQREKEILVKELEDRDYKITKFEQALANKEGEVTALKQAMAEAEKKLSDVNGVLAQAVASYKALIIESNPGMLAELVTGDTVSEVDESLKNARALIDRVRQEVEAEASKTRVPAGAPQRAPLDLSSLSPREKIQYAIGGNK